MLEAGSQAPPFSMVGIEGDETNTYRLTDYTGKGDAVLLLFYPFDFSPACTKELCSIRDAEWFQLTDDLQVWAVSTDSIYSHKHFSQANKLYFPLLSDTDGSVAETFGVRYDTWEGHKHVPKRAVFLIDSDQKIRYAWSTDDAYNQPELFAVNDALDELGTVHDDVTGQNIES